MSDAGTIEAAALAHCRQLHPAAACGMACDACYQVAETVERYRTALRIIAGELPPPDNLLGHADLARLALRK